jgi:hypothetical protein
MPYFWDSLLKCQRQLTDEVKYFNHITPATRPIPPHPGHNLGERCG